MFLTSCSNNVSEDFAPNILNSKSKIENSEVFQSYKESEYSISELEKTIACGTVVIPSGPKCQTRFVEVNLFTTGTMLEGICDFAPVSYAITICHNNNALLSISITKFEIDYDALALSCPGLIFPTDPAELQIFATTLERELAESAERGEVRQTLLEYEVNCNQGLSSVHVTRIAVSCFKFCWIPPSGEPVIFGPTKIICDGDICCFRSREYCINPNGSLHWFNESTWSTGSSCMDSGCDDFDSTSCEHDCDIVF